jgi:hypothetical protein
MKHGCLLLVVMAACGEPPEHDIDRLVHVDGPAPAACTGSWLARDGDGALVRFDASTGAVVARADAPHFGDLAVVGDRALALRQVEHGVVVDALDLGDGIGAPETTARAAAAERIAPLGDGVLFFAAALWTWVDAGRVRWEQELPVPRSLWSDDGGLHAWAGSLLTVSPNGDIGLEELDVPVDARLAPYGTGLAAAWVDDDRLYVSLGSGTRDVHIGPGNLADLAAVGDHHLAALLASPTRLVLLDPVDMAVTGRELEGSILSSHAFGRTLAVCSAHVVLVATSVGLERFDVARGPLLHRQETWRDLHAPMAGPLP